MRNSKANVALLYRRYVEDDEERAWRMSGESRGSYGAGYGTGREDMEG